MSKKKVLGNLVQKHNLKFFSSTVLKTLAVQFASFALLIFSFWIVLEMDYIFFVANGYFNSPALKAAFYNKIFLSLDRNILYFALVCIIAMASGMLAAWFTLKPFYIIEKLCLQLQAGQDVKFSLGKLESKRVIYRVTENLFNYLKTPNSNSSTSTSIKLIHPRLDKISLLQHCLIIGAMWLFSSLFTFRFTQQFYMGVVNTSLTLLHGNELVSSFITKQHDVFIGLYLLSTTLNALLSIYLSLSIIKKVDGVSYAFARDIFAIINGEHGHKVQTRLNDPGHNAVLAINDLIESTLIMQSDELPPPFDNL